MEEIIKKLRELHMMDIYTVNEFWCVDLFELDVCSNDYDVQPSFKFESVFETSGTHLYDVLCNALKWAQENKRYVS